MECDLLFFLHHNKLLRINVNQVGQLVGRVLALLHRHGHHQEHLSSNTNTKIVMGTTAAVTDKHSISLYLICIYFAFPHRTSFSEVNSSSKLRARPPPAH